MCTPLAVGGIAAGTALSAFGQIRSGQAAAESAKVNATLDRYAARDALVRGGMAAREAELAGRNASDEATVAMGKSGIEGGVVDNVVTQAGLGAMEDAAMLRANAAREAWGYAQSAKDRLAQGKIAKQSGVLGALGTGLAGIGSAASAWGSK